VYLPFSALSSRNQRDIVRGKAIDALHCIADIRIEIIEVTEPTHAELPVLGEDHGHMPPAKIAEAQRLARE